MICAATLLFMAKPPVEITTYSPQNLVIADFRRYF